MPTTNRVEILSILEPAKFRDPLVAALKVAADAIDRLHAQGCEVVDVIISAVIADEADQPDVSWREVRVYYCPPMPEPHREDTW